MGIVAVTWSSPWRRVTFSIVPCFGIVLAVMAMVYGTRMENHTIQHAIQVAAAEHSRVLASTVYDIVQGSRRVHAAPRALSVLSCLCLACAVEWRAHEAVVRGRRGPVTLSTRFILGKCNFLLFLAAVACSGGERGPGVPRGAIQHMGCGQVCFADGAAVSSRCGGECRVTLACSGLPHTRHHWCVLICSRPSFARERHDTTRPSA